MSDAQQLARYKARCRELTAELARVRAEVNSMRCELARHRMKEHHEIFGPSFPRLDLPRNVHGLK